MFRKFTNIIIAILLLATTTGFNISKHYCGDILVSVTLGMEAESCCDDENCCHNDTKWYQMEEDFIPDTGHINLENTYSVNLSFLPNILSDIFKGVVKTNEFTVFTDSSPPFKIQSRLSRLQTYLL